MLSGDGWRSACGHPTDKVLSVFALPRTSQLPGADQARYGGGARNLRPTLALDAGRHGNPIEVQPP